MAGVCIRMCSSVYHIPLRVVCLLLAFLQGCILNHYLVTHKNMYWYAWVVADLAVLLLFIMASIISYKHLILARKAVLRKSPIQTGSLPMAYFAWFVYSTLLAIRVAIIFKDFAWKLKEEDFFGPNSLKINISMAAFVFMMLLLSHHDAESNSERKHAITEISGTVVFDVLDSVDVLDTLFNKRAIDEFPPHFETAIIVIACINLILPTLPLMTLSKAHFAHKIIPREISILHKMLLVFLVNLPLLSIRLVLWHVLDTDISIFPVKNLLVIFVVFHDLYEKRREDIDREEEETDGNVDPDVPDSQPPELCVLNTA